MIFCKRSTRQALKEGTELSKSERLVNIKLENESTKD